MKLHAMFSPASRRRLSDQIGEFRRLAGHHSWIFPLITIIGSLSSFAEFLGVGLMIMLVYAVLGQPMDSSSTWGPLGRLFGAISAHVGSTTLIVCLILAAIAGKAILMAAYAALSSYVQNDLARAVRDRIHQQYLEVEYHYIREREEGEMLKVLAVESWAVSEAYQLVSRLVINLSALIVMLILLALISWPITLIAALGSAILFLALNLLGSPMRELSHSAAEINQRMAARMLQTLQGMRAIRAFGQEAHAQEAFEQVSTEARRIATKSGVLFALLSPASDSGYLLLLGGILAAASEISIPLATTLACVALLYRIQLPLRDLQNCCLALVEKEAALTSVLNTLRRSDKRYPDPGTVPLQALREQIVFQNVVFKYNASGPVVLDGVSFRIPACRTTALVGASGAGKTTIVNLLLRLDEPVSGQILIDGTPLNTIRRRDWLAHVALAGQDIDLMDHTVEANIRLARADADEAAIRDAAKLAGILDVIEAFPEGMQQWIGVHGANLSGGQRQRLGLARALLRDPDILILDEATSALDADIERTVRQNLKSSSKTRTVLIITHRLHTVLSVDHLICLQGGHVIEEGSPLDLQARPGGTFRRLLQEAGATGFQADMSVRGG